MSLMKIAILIALILSSRCGRNKISFSLFGFSQRSRARCLLVFLDRRTRIKCGTRPKCISIIRHEQRHNSFNWSSVTRRLTIVQFLIFSLTSKSLLMHLLRLVMLLPIVNTWMQFLKVYLGILTQRLL